MDSNKEFSIFLNILESNSNFRADIQSPLSDLKIETEIV
jgi:hypothetical protein